MKLRVFKADGRWQVANRFRLASFETWKEALRWAHAYVWAVENDHDTAPGWY